MIQFVIGVVIGVLLAISALFVLLLAFEEREKGKYPCKQQDVRDRIKP